MSCSFTVQTVRLFEEDNDLDFEASVSEYVALKAADGWAHRGLSIGFEN